MQGRGVWFCYVVLVVVHCRLVVDVSAVAQPQPQHSLTDLHWHPATATWYGSPEGDGSDGETSPKSTPFSFSFMGHSTLF